MDNGKIKTRPQSRLTLTRRLIQLYSALLYNANLKGFVEGEIYTGKTKYLCVPGLNCYSCPGAVGACPLGAMQNALASAGHRAGWYVLGIILLFGVIAGRTICGWLCPFGFLQELLHKIPSVKMRKSAVTRALSWLKYGILTVFAAGIPLWFGLTQQQSVPGFCKYICPAGTLEGAVPLLSNLKNADYFGMLGTIFTRKFVILVIMILACILCYRSFCRFLCPLGAIYGLFSRFNVIGVKVDETACNHCDACVRGCGMDVKHVGDHECIQCGKCMDGCAQHAISFRAGSICLAAPAGNEPNGGKRACKPLSLLVRGAALAFLVFALLWYNLPGPSGTGDNLTNNLTDNLSAPPGCEAGQLLPDFTVDCTDGSQFSLAKTKGKVTFINLWATYCGPCVKELSLFEELYHEHEGDIALLAVHSSMTTEDPAAYIEKKGWDIPFAVDTEDNLVWGIVGGGSTLPQTIVLDRNGIVIYNRVGSVTAAELAALYEDASSKGAN